MAASLVLKFSHLPNQPHPEKALSILERIASLVKPIMRHHSWTLPVLAEMLPAQDNLLGLNVNRGQKICIRLRPAGREDTFYEFEDLIGTMLHELAHNVHGPHDEKFYAFLKKLNEEYDELQSKGYTGDGFHSIGSRVGVNQSHDLPPHQAKAKALAAAEERARKQRLGGPAGGNGKLGGRRPILGKTPRELALDAAERRARDDRVCGSGECGGKEKKAMEDREVEKAEREGVVSVVVDLDEEGSEAGRTGGDGTALGSGSALTSATRPRSTSQSSNGSSSSLEILTPAARPPPSASSIFSKPSTSASISSSLPTASFIPIHKPKTNLPPPSSSEPAPPPKASIPLKRPAPSPAPSPSIPIDSTESWSCPVCTFHNSALLPRCEMCDSPPPRSHLKVVGWTCVSCGKEGNDVDRWSCSRCFTIKTAS